MCLVLWRSVCVTAGSLFGFYGLFNTACACRGKINEMMNKEKGNENFVLSLSSVCHTRLYEQLSLSLRKQHRWYILMYKACWVIALIIFIAYEQLLGLSLVFLVPGVKTESSNERKLLLSSWETWNLRSSTAECICDPDQILLSWLNTRSSRAGWSLASDCGSELTSPWSPLWSFPQTPHSYFLQMQTFFNFQSNQCYLKQQLPPGALYCKHSTIKQRKE